MAVKDKGRQKVEALATRLETLTVVYVPVASIKPNAYNPNRQSDHQFDMLVRSIETNGFTMPVLLQQDHTIIDGEHRWRAAQAVGLTEIPAVITSMTPEQMRVATITHNEARGQHDVELFGSLLRDIRELGALDWAVGELGMSDVEVQRLIEDIPAPEALASEAFSDAWLPMGTRHATSDGMDYHGGTEGVTENAATLLRAREKALAEAKTEQERQTIMRERKEVYRLALSFSDEEAIVVKAVLGNRPAERLLEVCRDVLRTREASSDVSN